MFHFPYNFNVWFIYSLLMILATLVGLLTQIRSFELSLLNCVMICLAFLIEVRVL